MPANSPPYWLFSAETLNKIPEFAQSLKVPWFQEYLPKSLMSNQVLEIPLFFWVVFPFVLCIVFGFLWLVTWLLGVLAAGILRLIGKRDVVLARASFLGVIEGAASGPVPQAPTQAQAAPGQKSPGASLGIFPYPKNNQTPAQQLQDKTQCFFLLGTDFDYTPKRRFDLYGHAGAVPCCGGGWHVFESELGAKYYFAHGLGVMGGVRYSYVKRDWSVPANVVGGVTIGPFSGFLKFPELGPFAGISWKF